VKPVRGIPMVSFRRPRGDNRGRMKYTAAAVLFGLAACGEVNSTDDDGGDDGVTVLIDDLEDGDAFIPATDGRRGNWYTVNDGTGNQSPDIQFVPTLGGASDSDFCAATNGSGFTIWGAKLGVYLNHPDSSEPAATFDAGGYRGVRFWARGNVTVRATVNVMAARGSEIGGVCDETLGGCNDYHGRPVVLEPGWREYSLDFGVIAQEGWGQSIPFDPSEVVAIDFSVPANVPFDFAIDDLVLYE
jgi:hypothetical protein